MWINGFLLTYLYAVIACGFWWKSCLKKWFFFIYLMCALYAISSRFCKWSCMFGFICGGSFSGFWVEFFSKELGLFCFSIFFLLLGSMGFFIPIYAVVAHGFWKESFLQNWVFYVLCNFWKVLQILLCLDFYMPLFVVFWSALFYFLKEKRVWCFFLISIYSCHEEQWVFLTPLNFLFFDNPPFLTIYMLLLHVAFK